MIVNAGSDTGANGMDFDAVREAISTGLIEEEALDRATTHRMTALMKMGRFENPYRDLEQSQAAYDEVADEIAALQEELNLKSVVLMKNHESALPLDTSKKVFVKAFTAGSNNRVTANSKRTVSLSCRFCILCVMIITIRPKGGFVCVFSKRLSV